jgi:hypothetical protein
VLNLKSIVAAAAAGAIVLSLQADVISWDNADGGSWANPSNWDPNQVPGSSDTARFALTEFDVVIEIPPTVPSIDACEVLAGSYYFTPLPPGWPSVLSMNSMLVQGTSASGLALWQGSFSSSVVEVGRNSDFAGALWVGSSTLNCEYLGIGTTALPSGAFGGLGQVATFDAVIDAGVSVRIGTNQAGIGQLHLTSDSWLTGSGIVSVGFAGYGALLVDESTVDVPLVELGPGVSLMWVGPGSTVESTVEVGLSCAAAPPPGNPQGVAELVVDGNVTGIVKVGRRGAVSGTGEVTTMFNAGFLVPGDSEPGLLTFFDYTQSATDCADWGESPQLFAGELHIRVAGPSEYGRLWAIWAELAGGLVLTFENDYDPKPGDSFNVLTADYEGFVGAWDYLVHPPLPGRTVRIDYDSGEGFIWVVVEAAEIEIIFDDPVQTDIFGGPVALTSGVFQNGPRSRGVVGSDLAVVVHVESMVPSGGQRRPRGGAETNGRVLVLENDGDNMFEVVPYEVGNDPTDIAAADLLGDGQLELIVTNGGDDTITILRNTAQGFETHAIIPVGSNPSAVVAADFQNSGRADIIVANRDDNTILILENQGDGTFVALPPINVGAEPVDLAMADLNGSGFLDLVVANFGDGTVYVFLNTGGGEAAASFFGLPQVVFVGGSPSAVNLDDYDHDKDIDIVVATRGSRTMEFLENGGGTFEHAMSVLLDGEPTSITTWDIDGAGSRDIAVAVETEEGEIVQIWRNDGVGEFFFTQVLELGEEDLPLLVEHADVDGDGNDDLITVNRAGALAIGGQTSSVSVYINRSGFVCQSNPQCEIVGGEPVCGSTYHTLTVIVTDGEPPFEYHWTVTGDGWAIVDGQGTDTITVQAGPEGSEGAVSVTITDATGCSAVCSTVLSCVAPVGCGGGLWKQPHQFDNWPAPYTPGMLFSDAFGSGFKGKTLHQVLSQPASSAPGPPQLNSLGRFAVAALLNAAGGGYLYSVGQVIDMFHEAAGGTIQQMNAMKALFAEANGAGCAMNGNPDLTGDNLVDAADLLIMLDEWGRRGSTADLNSDGIVDMLDMLILFDAWGHLNQ